MLNIFRNHRLTRKEKKKALQKKNQMHQGVFNLMLARRANANKIKALKEANERDKKKKRSREEEKREDKKEIWSVKVSTIRDRLTNRKRTTEDRWNRFAGTEDGGGRGR